MNYHRRESRNPWAWIPSLYFAEGLPYVVVMTVSVIMYKRLGISNTDIALYTSWLYLPWVIKPLWSPVVDLLKTKRTWIVVTQLLIGGGLAGVALTIPIPGFFQYTLAFFWLLAFSSATHDIAADGFYMLGLSENQQAFYVGFRSTFYRVAMIVGQGILVIFAGHLETSLGIPPTNFEVEANPRIVVSQRFDPDSIHISPVEGELRVVAVPGKLEISTTPTTLENAEFWKSFAENLNDLNGFNDSPMIYKAPNGTNQFVGNIGVVYFHLSKNPGAGEEIPLNLLNYKGNENIRILAGGEYIFNENNWNRPALAVIQLGSSIEDATSATFKIQSNNIQYAWMFTFLVLALLFIVFFLYHKAILPYPKTDSYSIRQGKKNIFNEFFKTFLLFFKRPGIGFILAFLLLYRFGEAQLVKLAAPFLLDGKEVGGLALSTSQVGFVYGTVGIIALVVGGILGGFLAARHGLKKWLWPMVLAINIPNLVYVYLAYMKPVDLTIIAGSIAFEQFGYGLGFTAYVLYMIYIADGEYKTSHYAIATGFMALGM
ncbi:MFS transporter, partial [Bacteroidota bacterium]